MKQLLLSLFLSTTLQAQTIHPSAEYANTLERLSAKLVQLQQRNSRQPEYGGIWCEHCQVWHTRAAEAVFPLTVSYFITKDKHYLQSAKLAAAWLFRQQQKDGSWKETPEEWTGTTTDQLLMLLLSYEKLQTGFSSQEKQAWQQSMRAAAAFLHRVMRPEFASINYVATTTATLAKAGLVLNDTSFTNRAKELARRTIAKMDEDGFLYGEGGKSYGNKMGIDLGYNMEMSLWGLGLYAKLTNDTFVYNRVQTSLQQHLYFIYPNGALDASWGIRSNKWTGYGSATSDGCQALFSLMAKEDPRYATAAMRNLEFLRRHFTKDGLLGFGLQYDELFNKPPCIYPTFAKAKNLAMAYEWDNAPARNAAALPADSTGWMKYFPSLDVVQVRTRTMMATITAYRYKDPAGTKGKYMYRPAGGAISHLWLEGNDFLQASSPTVYTRPEPMSFPEAPGVVSLTPRIEYTDSLGYFTNLYEYDARLTAKQVNKTFYVSAFGELKDKNFLTGGIGYGLHYTFSDKALEKKVEITWHDARRTVRIVEPFITGGRLKVIQQDAKTVILDYGNKKLRLQITEGNATLVSGEHAANYWTPYPSLRAWPVELIISPDIDAYNALVRYVIAEM
ncbi:hypothetical protein [Terrimonas ferruginea]|uniref:hypothetical protein n=1 Tax=Terrimonas ferruginea TaxID=249 RepID=UPI0003FD2833|nr:hypothetical protein [Terrimonas ferruginea]